MALIYCDLDYLNKSRPTRDDLEDHLYYIASQIFNRCTADWILSKGYRPTKQNSEQNIKSALRHGNYNYIVWSQEHDDFGFIIPKDLKIKIENLRLKLSYHEEINKSKVFPRTKRPFSTMLFTGNNCQEGEKYLPVVRYEDLFQKVGKPRPVKSCGTFYYYEPDSSSYLKLGDCLVAANKVDAVWKLEGYENGLPYLVKNGKLVESRSLRVINEFLAEFYPGTFEELLQEYLDDPNEDTLKNLEKEAKSKESKHLMKDVNGFFTQLLTDEEDVDELIDVIKYDENEEEDRLNRLYVYDSNDEYQGDLLLQRFDYLDQDICKLAREQEYDTILLQREPGGGRVVTEIIDTRSRTDSYASICKEKFDLPTHKTEYPTIWFSNYGFMTY